MITFLIFAVVIIVADICLLVSHNRSFSERENRVLAKAPVLTATGLTSGKYMDQAESFISDQFFLRDGWITYKLEADKLLGKKESNGIILGRQGYLIEPVSMVNEQSFARNLDAIREFGLRHSDLNIVMTVVPNAVCVLSHLLPSGVPAADQTEVLRMIQSALAGSLSFVDVTDALKAHNTEYIYYKSDHHWTSLGAKYAFEALCPALGISAAESSFTDYLATARFSGTLSSASGTSYVKDEIHIYVPEPSVSHVVEYVGESLKTATIYNSAALETNSKYDVFFGGNHPLIKIRTAVPNRKSLLVIKDSYANAFIQFLLPYYGNIYIMDPRYYSDDVDKLISTGEITDVLLLYNVNTFVEDNSIAGVLAAEDSSTGEVLAEEVNSIAEVSAVEDSSVADVMFAEEGFAAEIPAYEGGAADE